MLTLFTFLWLGFNFSLSLVLDTRFRSDLVRSRQFYSNKDTWYDYGIHQKTIVYAIDPEFRLWEENYIKAQIEKLTTQTCLKALEYPFDETCNYYISCIRFLKPRVKTDCFTDRWTREITVPRYCINDQLVLHEILHALGFGHEHQRPDRDCYVEVIGEGLTNPQYRKDSYIDIGFPYDVHSIMHYRRGERMKPANFTLNQDQEFGSRDELTEMDIIALNYMFCGGKHYCDINPERCQYFRCWIECNPCSEEPISQCKDCTGNTY